MNVLITVSPGELLDKITILRIKSQQIEDPDKLANVNRELEIMNDRWSMVQDTFANNEAIFAEMSFLDQELERVNKIIWDIEDGIRDCERRKDFGEEFINFARGVYKNNDQRAVLKRRVNETLNSELMEEKSYTDYE